MSEWDPVILNLAYACVGGALGLIGSWMAGRLFSNIMGFKIRDELKAGNVAVGLAVMGIFIGSGICMGLIIGLSLN
ncbi:MAG: DUF350 domain-containing protein [Gammaproteobacteria bacterium]|nr:DUF350 domain-containing protein [Gammaproteobacteria bacterium]